jgi:hypothetical protein
VGTGDGGCDERGGAADLDALIAGAHTVDIECHTQSCRLAVGVEDRSSVRLAAMTLQIGTLGEMMEFTPHRQAGDNTVEVHAIMDSGSRELAIWNAANRRKRRAFLDALAGQDSRAGAIFSWFAVDGWN